MGLVEWSACSPSEFESSYNFCWKGQNKQIEMLILEWKDAVLCLICNRAHICIDRNFYISVDLMQFFYLCRQDAVLCLICNGVHICIDRKFSISADMMQSSTELAIEVHSCCDRKTFLFMHLIASTFTYGYKRFYICKEHIPVVTDTCHPHQWNRSRPLQNLQQTKFLT